MHTGQMVARILVVHEDTRLRHSLADCLRRAGEHVSETADVNEALVRGDFSHSDYDVVLLGRRAGVNASKILQLVQREWPSAEIVVVDTSSELPDAIGCTREGVAQVVHASGDRARVADAVRLAIREHIFRTGLPGVQAGEGAIAVDPTTRAVFAKAARAAAVNSTVLITGESGTGKEVIARQIHRHSTRKRSKFVPVNCGGIPDSLVETELFGYRKGAFTGAVSNTKGLIEEAESGTLFLDEIGDMPLAMQVHLLRFLDTGEIRPVGGGSVGHADVRVLAATNRNLEQEIRQRRFREDLYFRLNVINLHLPPLRERKADIPELVEHHLRRAATRLGVPVPTLSPEVLPLLNRYDWPGNVRQLQNVLEQAIVQACDGVVTSLDLPDAIVRTRPVGVADADDDAERERLLTSLRRHNGNHTHAAAELGISRTTLWRRLGSAR